LIFSQTDRWIPTDDKYHFSGGSWLQVHYGESDVERICIQNILIPEVLIGLEPAEFQKFANAATLDTAVRPRQSTTILCFHSLATPERAQ
jgi:hypothetical protein